MLVQNVLELHIQLLPLTEEIVQIDLAQHGAQRGLSELRRGVQIILHFRNRARSVHHSEVHDRIHLHRDVVPRNDVLRGDVQRDRSQADAHHFVHRPEDPDQPRALGLVHQTPQPEDDRPFVFLDDVDRAQQIEYENPASIHYSGDLFHGLAFLCPFCA